MSGIAGIIRFDDQPVDREELARVANAAPWRSPEGIDSYFQNNAGLAQLRFNPCDLQTARTNDLPLKIGDVVIVADARLDNKAEVTHRLTKSGHLKHKPSNTTEILHAAWRLWGQDLVDHLQGEFALAIWDKEAQTITLARDALGGGAACFTTLMASA